MSRRATMMAALPGITLFVGFLVAVWFQNGVLGLRVPRTLSAVAPAAAWLDQSGFRVRRIVRWSHQPINDGSNAATFVASEAVVHIVVFTEADDLRQVRIAEYRLDDGRYRYQISGLPGSTPARAWMSRYRWFFTIRGNWLLVSTDAGVEERLRMAASKGS